MLRMSLNIHLLQITCWDQPNLRCLPQLINFSQDNNGCKLDKLTDIELKLGVVADTYTHTLSNNTFTEIS